MLKLSGLLALVLFVGLAVSPLGCAATQTTESAGQYIDDTTITTKVKAAIIDDQALKSFQISVETYKGEVQLSGFVDSAQSASKAGDTARGVQGVVSVKNNLIVK